jgi:glycolate oxidase FAD binding subunit
MPLSTRIDELLGDRVGRLSHWGGPNVPIASPRSESDVLALLDAARADGLAVLPIGNGTKLDHALIPTRVDLALSTRRLTGIVAYEPAEGVLTARAGTSLRVLRETVAAHGHHFSPEVPHEDRATLGGVVSAAPSGADRLRHGPVRDRVLGVRLARTDGRVVRSGGALVKDVAGYDLQRLVVGAHGSLGVVLEVSIRLASAADERVLVRRCLASVDEGLELARALAAALHASLRALRIDGDPERPWLTVDIEGRAAVVERSLAHAHDVLGPVHVLRDAGAKRVADELRESRRLGGRWPQLEIDALPSRFGAALVAVRNEVRDAKLSVELHPALGLGWVRFAHTPGRAGAHTLARALSSAGATSRWCGLDAELRRELVEAAGPPAGLALMERLRRAFDPTDTLATPRLHPELGPS